MEPVESQEGEIEAVEVILNPVVGFSEPQTIKVLVTIQGRRVDLIDGGATYNFLARAIVE